MLRWDLHTGALSSIPENHCKSLISHCGLSDGHLRAASNNMWVDCIFSLLWKGSASIFYFRDQLRVSSPPPRELDLQLMFSRIQKAILGAPAVLLPVPWNSPPLPSEGILVSETCSDCAWKFLVPGNLVRVLPKIRFGLFKWLAGFHKWATK